MISFGGFLAECLPCLLKSDQKGTHLAMRSLAELKEGSFKLVCLRFGGSEVLQACCSDAAVQ